MLQKHAILLGIIISVILLTTAASNYPGGSPADKSSIGYSWENNFISNLFGERALNDAPNTARYWAVSGMIFLSIACSIFFVEFSGKIPAKGAASVIKYFGIAGMLFTALIATPFHDIMITIASTIFLLSMFYVTVFVFKSRLHLFKFLCALYLLSFYSTLIVFSSGYFLEYLPIIQKVLFANTILLILGLHYFSKAEDFKNLKTVKLEQAGTANRS
ncbi:hypothetical protein GZH53_01180 [Flavihumibacter sp. R14]|nr:hypothetical protein [Flavihumibacter soli]